MNASIIYKTNVKITVLDELARELPVIIAKVMEVPGGNVARLKPEQISLVFSQASTRDVGSDIKIILFAKNNDFRTSTGTELANEILEKVVALNSRSVQECSVDVRLYFMEIAAAEHALAV